MEPETGLVIDTTTVLSLLSTLAILATAHISSLYVLPSSATGKVRFLFIWHAFDALIHFILEGSYLWNCFFCYAASPLSSAPVLLPEGVHFLARPDRVYGALYGTNAFSALWREYAKADARWGGTDLTVISLELLTVFGGGPLAVWICSCLAKSQWGRAWFWMCVLATAELYGGEYHVSQLWALIMPVCFPFCTTSRKSIGFVDVCFIGDSLFSKLHITYTFSCTTSRNGPVECVVLRPYRLFLTGLCHVPESALEQPMLKWCADSSFRQQDL